MSRCGSPALLSSLWRYCILVGMVLLLCGLNGCSQGEYPLVELSGTVTFDGGECPGPGNVTLQPLEVSDELPKRPSSGRFGVDGHLHGEHFQRLQGCFAGALQVGGNLLRWSS